MAKKKQEVKVESKEDSQPDISIGLVGHVDHGKTTLVEALSGKWTDTHSEEIKRGITIRLGYADVNFYKSDDKYSVKKEEGFVKVLGASLVDAPGHESLMATMLCGANIMDGALLLVSAAEECPQPQTLEHLQALELIGMENVIIVQNKVDLVSDEQALRNFEQIKDVIKDTKFRDAPIIPVSALHHVNIDLLVKEIVERFKVPVRDVSKPPMMFVARSFDINKPGSNLKDLAGGVLGGALKQGVLKVGDEIEILPGYEVEEKNIKLWKPLRTKIAGLMAGGKKVEQVRPGGTFAVLTFLDPSVVKSDNLVGSVVGYSGQLPQVRSDLTLNVKLLERVVGSKDKLVVDPIKPTEPLMLNVYSAATVGFVKTAHKVVHCVLRRPVCADKGARVSISRNFGQRWRLIGFGTIE